MFTNITNHKVVIFNSEISGIWVNPIVITYNFIVEIVCCNNLSCINSSIFRSILPTSRSFECSNSVNFITTSRFHERLTMRHKCTNKITKTSSIFCKRDFEYIPNFSTSIQVRFRKCSSMLHFCPIWPCNFSMYSCGCLGCISNGITNICGD